MDLKKIFEEADQLLANGLHVNGHVPPCHAGCFYCCKEAVYCCDLEVAYMLESLTQQQKDELKGRVFNWFQRFTATPLRFIKEPHMNDYRPVNLWCPLMENAMCSVYERRPLACRFHVAIKDPKFCKNDWDRQNQTFANFPGITNDLQMKMFELLQEGESVTYDHLGILLYEALFGGSYPTAARLKFTPQGDTLICEKYAEG